MRVALVFLFLLLTSCGGDDRAPARGNTYGPKRPGPAVPPGLKDPKEEGPSKPPPAVAPMDDGDLVRPRKGLYHCGAGK